MRESRSEVETRRGRRMHEDEVGRMREQVERVRVVGEALEMDSESAVSSEPRAVVWRWHMRRRRQSA